MVPQTSFVFDGVLADLNQALSALFLKKSDLNKSKIGSTHPLSEGAHAGFATARQMAPTDTQEACGPHRRNPACAALLAKVGA